MKKEIFILTNTLKSGGAEKQSIYLAKALSSYYNVRLIVYYGNQYDERMVELLNGFYDQVVWLKGTHINRLLYLYRLFHINRHGIVISYLATTNLINAIIGTIAGIHIKIGGVRNSKLKPFKNTIQKMIHNYLLTCSVFNNKQGLKELSVMGYKKNKSILIHNCIDIKQTEIEKEQNDKITILTVSRFVDQKDYKTAIKAFQEAIKLSDTQKKIRYIIVGYGPLEMELRELVKSYNISNHVEFVVNPPDVDAYYKKADVYLSTSLFEGLSNSIMEAMSFSLPVVATDVGDNNQLVIQGETGLLVNVKDVDAIANIIATLIKDKELRKSMGKRGYKHISKNFSIDTFTQKYISLIKQLSNESCKSNK